MPLLIVEHHGTRRMAPLARRVLIGRRAGNHVVINDRTVAMIHAWIDKRGEECVLTDTGSRTGTLVNGKRIARPLPLVDGDVITVGPATLTFDATGGPEGVDAVAIATALAPAVRAIAVETPPPPSAVPPVATIPPAAIPSPVAPPPPPPPPPLRVDSSAEGWLFDCACGAPLWAGASFAGRTAYCRYCGREVRVPDAEAAAAAAAAAGIDTFADRGPAVAVEEAEYPGIAPAETAPESVVVGAEGPTNEVVAAAPTADAEAKAELSDEIASAEPVAHSAVEPTPEPEPPLKAEAEPAPSAVEPPFEPVAVDESPAANELPSGTTAPVPVFVDESLPSEPQPVAADVDRAAALESPESNRPFAVATDSPTETDAIGPANATPGTATVDPERPLATPDAPRSSESELNELVSALAAAEETDEPRAPDAPFMYEPPPGSGVLQAATEVFVPPPGETATAEPILPAASDEPAPHEPMIAPNLDARVDEVEHTRIDASPEAELIPSHPVPDAPDSVLKAGEASSGESSVEPEVSSTPGAFGESTPSGPPEDAGAAPAIEPPPAPIAPAAAAEPTAEVGGESAPITVESTSASLDATEPAVPSRPEHGEPATAATAPAAAETLPAAEQPPTSAPAPVLSETPTEPFPTMSSVAEEATETVVPPAVSHPDVVTAAASPVPVTPVRPMPVVPSPTVPAAKPKTAAAAATAATRGRVAPPPARPGKFTPLKASRTCGICQSGILFNEKTTTCPSCGLTFHTDCWTENRGCSAYGCPQVGILDAKQPGPAGAGTSAEDGGSADDDAAVAEEAAAVEREAAKSYAKAPFPWEFATLAASAVSLLLSAFTFGVPSMLVGAATMIYLSKKPGVRRKTGVLLLSTLIALVGFVGGAMLSWFWYFGSGTGGGSRR